MKTLVSLSLSLICLAFLAGCAVAAEKHENQKPALPGSFLKLTKLVGEWEGETTEDGKTQKVSASYELTSAGTALVEKLFKGTPHEMTTVYYAEGKGVGLTHFCSIGNHPRMEMKNSDERKMVFNLKGAKGIKSKNEPHMHGLTVSFLSDNEIQQDWLYYDEGKAKGNTVIKLARKK